MLTLALSCGPAALVEGGEREEQPRDSDAPEAVSGFCDDVSWPELWLNELVASNVQGLEDEQGGTPDWVELHNPTDQPIDLTDWTLSDEGTSWTLPSEDLPAGGFLLVMASGDEGELHASFSIAAEGETVSLAAPDGCVVDELPATRLYADVSYGRPSEQPDTLGFFLEPTPGQANTTEARPGFADPPALDPAPGFYDELTVTLEHEHTIRYTLDGAAPQGDDPLYEAPLTLDADTPVQVVRARAFETGLWPSRVTTGVYATPDLLDRYGLKLVSLVVDPFDLFDEATGIYAYGPPDYTSYYPYFGANFWEDWERDVHVTVFDVDGTAVLDEDAGIKIHGGYTRAFEQKNFRLIARAGYGEDTLDHRFFPLEELDEFPVVVLEGAGDWCPTHTENAVVDQLFRDDDGVRFHTLDSQAWEPTVVYLNGTFWGLYAFREKLDEHYVAAHHGADPDDLDRIECTADGTDDWWRVSQGDWEAFDALNAFVAAGDFSDDDAYAELQQHIDVENLATAVLAEGWFGNSDWWDNNIKLWRERTPGTPFRHMVFDLGHGWPSSSYDHLGTSVGFSGPGLPIADALANDAFRVMLANQGAELLSTSLQADTARARLAEMHDRIRPVIPDQYALWCGASPAAWEASAASAEDFAYAREDVLRGQLLRHLDLGAPVPLTLDTEPDAAGRFSLTLIEVDAPFSGTFFSETPVTVTAVPAEGWAFAGWEHDGGADATVTVELVEATSLVAHFDPI